ncbi:MAG: tRNA pseudouridine(38-40) synthase TruA [Candidatus Eisenbacteria bacterium]|nr:tRNA pseudouridine(38-40) synthase TruA [Candidatus Eisenbacteria bacterium]
MSDARTFRLTVAYDGTAFFGWQKQPDVRTVQGELEAALSRALGGVIKTAGAGRTDTGVHARGQVSSFVHDTTMPARALPHVVNPLLPADMRIMDAVEAAPRFHARHSAIGRRYEYRVLTRPDLLRDRTSWTPLSAPPLELLQQACTPLRGVQDYSAFASTGSESADPVFGLHLARWREAEGGYAFDVIAHHFLYHMVRNLVGTAFAAAKQADPAAHMRAVLESRDRRRAGQTVPPKGLSLEEVYYEGEPVPWAAPGEVA